MSKVMIFSLEHDAWWKANGQGYTQSQVCAGLYDLEDADRIVEDANRHRRFPEKRNEILVQQFDNTGVTLI